jgi:hypothetical protein
LGTETFAARDTVPEGYDGLTHQAGVLGSLSPPDRRLESEVLWLAETFLARITILPANALVTALPK